MLILNKLSNRIDTKTLIILIDLLDMEVFKSFFKVYLLKYHLGFFRLLNKNYLNFLSNISELTKELKNSNLIEKLNSTNSKSSQKKKLLNKIKIYTESINLEFKFLFYKSESKNEKENKKETSIEFYRKIFKEKKKQFIDIHELILRIGYNLTSNIEYTISLYSSFFFDDVVDFLILISKGNLIDNYLKYHTTKSEEEAKSLLSSIVENSINILHEGFKLKIFDDFYDFKRIVKKIFIYF